MGSVKKIIFCVTNDLVHDQRMNRICRSIQKAGFEVTLAGRLLSNSKELINEPYHQKRLWCFFSKGKLFYIEYNIRLLFWLFFQKTDGICAVDLDTIIPSYIAGKLKGVKLSYDAHELFTDVPEVINRPAIQKIWQKIEKTFVPGFELCYTVSHSIAIEFKKRYGKDFLTIRNVPILQYDFIPADNFSRRLILYQGALNEGRGLEALISAMHDIDAKLWIAGEGDLSQQLREQVKKEMLESKIKFLGFIAPKDLKAITVQATIGFNVAENKGLSYYLSLNNKFFDYIHAAVPQVINNFPEFATLNEKYKVGITVNDCNKTEIAATINEVLNNFGSYSEFSANCILASKELNWNIEEVKLIAAYHELYR
jgi:glycosyltransferase involved in cell wall biosynthesis